MPATVFFSWQSDTLATNGKNFIERVLEKGSNGAENRCKGYQAHPNENLR
jgi:hypothetical protein